ncbi:MAG: sulfatase-like hydrolase/transferase [Pirellulales bacterium]|nr:sulfatase-like hydrolase/transferase [Pirellulales bacterium]
MHAHDHFPDEIWDGGKMVAVPGNKNKKKETYIPYEQEKKALELIQQNKSKPFFLYLAVTPPHGAYIIPETDPTFAMYEGIPGGKQVQHYAAMITRTDQMVGKILDTLSELQLDKDTIIFYTSDNGPNAPFVKAIDSAGGLRGTKRLLYEGGIRAAMAVRWPDHVPAGRKSTFVWDMRDIFPTLCELANAKNPENLDGISVVPTLMGKKQKSRDIHYWEIHSPFQQAVRSGDWKAIRFGTEEPLELYDLKNDPQETQNVAADNPAVVKKLETFLASARTDSPYFPAVQKKKRKKKKAL